MIGLPAVIVAAILVALVVTRITGADIEGLASFGAQDRSHDAAVEYEESSLPPVGGTHSPNWQNCGIYDQPVEIKNAVHSMEHGAVWVAYQPDLPASDVDTLQNLVSGQTYVLLSPYPGLESPVVLTAWGIQLQVDGVDDERVAQFVDNYRLGPQTPEFGAPCTGGVGRPIG
jgi:hypothetical protein